MRTLWGWYGRRRLRTRVVLALVLLPILSAALYVAGRSLQYAAAEKDAGVFAPPKAQVVVRARDLEAHWERIRKSRAWLVLKRRVLRDPQVRRPLNAALRDAGLPAIDDLEDVRKAKLYSEENLFRAAGRDFVAAVRVRDEWKTARWCLATRLRWSDYLLAPLAGLVLPSESVGTRSAFRLSQGPADVFLAFEGALAIASNDRALLEDALRRKGAGSPPSRPVEARLDFEGSQALAGLRSTIGRTGLLPHVKISTVRALEASADVTGKAGEAVALDLLLSGAEAAYPTGPPHAFAGFAPPASSGALVSQVGVQDLYAWLQSLVDRGGKGGFVSENAAQAVEQLERAGFTSSFLPRVDRGMALVTGIEDRGGRSWPSFALLVASPDGKAAAEALSGVIKAIAGKMEGRLRETPVLDTVLYHWEWHGSLPIKDFLTPSYAGIPGGLVFGNNLAFTESVIHAAQGSASFQGERLWRDLQGRLRAHGFSAEPAAAGGFAFVPRLKESLDGLIPRAAEWILSASLSEREIGDALDRELREQGRSVTPEERRLLFLERRERLVQAEEEELRRSLAVLDPLTWALFESQPAPKGVTFRLVVELR